MIFEIENTTCNNLGTGNGDGTGSIYGNGSGDGFADGNYLN